jgi:asparagine synthase (glutamine-hydrolysing)
MFGFFVEELNMEEHGGLCSFCDERFVLVGGYKLLYSPGNSAHNYDSYENDLTPFIFICGEISNFDEFGYAKFDDDFVKGLSKRVKKHGIAAVSKLRGLFAFFAYDPLQEKTWIYSDSIGGFCTIYYSVDRNSFACSTSLKHVVRGVETARVHVESLSRLVSTGYVLPPNTLAEGIQKLRPGCLMTVEASGTREEQVSVLPFKASRTTHSGSAGEEQLLAYMEKFVTADSCFLLSGGLDSSTLVAMAAKHFGPGLACFTGVFSGYDDLDESRYAKIVAKHCSVDLHCVELGHDSVLQNLPEIVEAIGEPFLDDSILPTFALFKEIKKNYDTVFSGDGPDHLFNRYYPLAAKRTLGCVLKRVHFLQDKNKYIDRLFRSASDDIEFAYSDLFALPHWKHNRRSEILELMNVICRNEFESSYIYKISDCRGSLKHDDNLRCVNLADFYIDGSFGVFSKVGKSASALELHIREPYLASPFAEFSAGMSMSSKFRGGLYAQVMSKCVTKSYLRDQISIKYLPATILTRQKGGFVPPLESWLRDFLNHAHVLDRFSDVSKWCLNMELVNGIFGRFLRDNVHGCLIFMLISFDR